MKSCSRPIIVCSPIPKSLRGSPSYLGEAEKSDKMMSQSLMSGPFTHFQNSTLQHILTFIKCPSPPTQQQKVNEGLCVTGSFSRALAMIDCLRIPAASQQIIRCSKSAKGCEMGEPNVYSVLSGLASNTDRPICLRTED